MKYEISIIYLCISELFYHNNVNYVRVYRITLVVISSSVFCV